MDEFMFPLPADCPPGDARSTRISLYRLVRRDPPTEADFIPQASRNPSIQPEGPCDDFAISTLQTLQDAFALKKIFRKRVIAFGQIDETDGVILEDPTEDCPSHTNWWPYRDSVPHVKFHVIGEADSDA